MNSLRGYLIIPVASALAMVSLDRKYLLPIFTYSEIQMGSKKYK